LSACKYVKQQQEATVSNNPLARVYDKYLYPADLKGMGANSSKNDSLNMVNMYVQDWVKTNLMVHKAKENLPKELLDIDQKVENYRQSLIIYNYESELIHQKLDTFISADEKLKYYKQYPDNFVLDESIFQLQFIKALKQTPGIDSWPKLMKSETQEDAAMLKAMSKNSAIGYMLEKDKWYTAGELMQQLQISAEVYGKIRPDNRNIQKIEHGDAVIFIKWNEQRNAGEVAPFERVSEKIYLILLNKKKSVLLDNIYKDIYQTGQTNKDFEIFMTYPKTAGN